MNKTINLGSVRNFIFFSAHTVFNPAILHLLSQGKWIHAITKWLGLLSLRTIGTVTFPFGKSFLNTCFIVTKHVSSLLFPCRFSQENAGLTDSTWPWKASLNVIVGRSKPHCGIELQNVGLFNTRKTVICTIEMPMLGIFCFALLGSAYGMAGKLFFKLSI